MNGTTKIATCLLVGLIWAGPAGAEIYKSIDKDGNVVFSDHPPNDPGNQPEQVEEVKLEHVNTAPPPAPLPQSAPPKEPASPAPNYTLAISSPADQTTIPNGPGDFAVTVSASPRLVAGESLQLLIDGQPHGEPQLSTTWQLTNIFRGAHQLSVQRTAKDGTVLATSSAVTVYVQRPSIIRHPR